MNDKKLLELAFELVQRLDKVADKNLPQEIVDVVKLHSKLAVGSAWIPIPGADVAAGAATVWGMYIRINNKIGLSFSDNVIKSIGSGVATNLASYIAMSGVASAMKFVPGIGTLGGAIVMSASLYAVTLVSGWIYLKALCTLAEKDGSNLKIRQFGIRICLEKFQLPALFNAHWQCLGLILEETVCCQCRTEIHKEVMYRAMA